ncbi:hypothetical protein ABW20_dc0109482 [Dactylellina cionopaga]|nr:hypothetical protein ABW20_dc0109482 [Dactylellina cionopaga]
MGNFNNAQFDIVVQRLLVLAVATPVAYFLFYAIYQIYFSPLAKVPGPWYTAVSRFWLASKVMAGKRIFAVHELQEKYGPFVRISPTEIAVADLNSIKAIHTGPDAYPKSDWYKGLTDGIDAVFALIHNDEHRHRRKAYGNAFSNTNIAKLEPVVRKHVNTCVEKIKREVDAGGRPNILQWVQFMSTDVIGDVSYGRDFGMLEKETTNPIIQDLMAIMMIGGVRAEFPFLKTIHTILSYIPHSKVQWFVNSNKRIAEYGDNALSDMRREIENCKDKHGNPRPSLFTKLLDDINDPSVKYKMDMEQLRHEATNNMIAGSDTVTITGTYMIWAIFRHPEIRKKLEEELDSMLGRQEITDEKVQQLPYFKLVVKETLRVYSAAQFGIPRAVPEGGRQLGGYFFPAGTEVTSQAYTMHRNSKVFEDPYV